MEHILLILIYCWEQHQLSKILSLFPLQSCNSCASLWMCIVIRIYGFYLRYKTVYKTYIFKDSHNVFKTPYTRVQYPQVRAITFFTHTHKASEYKSFENGKMLKRKIIILINRPRRRRLYMLTHPHTKFKRRQINQMRLWHFVMRSCVSHARILYARYIFFGDHKS